MYALCVGFRKCDALILCELFRFDKLMKGLFARVQEEGQQVLLSEQRVLRGY